MCEPPLDSLASLSGAQLRLTVGHRSFGAPDYGAQTDTIEGRLWAYDAALQLVVLETDNTSALAPQLRRAAAAAVYAPTTLSTTAGAHTPAQNGGKYTGFKLVHAGTVKRYEVLAHGSADALSRTVPVDAAVRSAREASAVRRSAEKAERTGDDVSDLGQAVFDALNKTLPCRWHGPHIIVLDEVVVSGPEYDTDRTYVPGLERTQVDALINGEDAAPHVERASAKARVWQRVVKVLQGERARQLL